MLVYSLISFCVCLSLYLLWIKRGEVNEANTRIRCNKSVIHQMQMKRGSSMIESQGNKVFFILLFNSALITYLFSKENMYFYYWSSWADLFHPVHVMAWPSLCHCTVCAVAAGAADGADVSVNALHVCKDAAFLNPPTQSLVRRAVCLLL